MIHETECDLTIICYKIGTTVRIGEFWDQTVLTCRASKDTSVATRRSDTGTLTSPTAVLTGLARCCPKGQGFSAQYGCINTPSCVDSCDDEAEAVATDRRKFRQLVPGRVGTAFRQDTCDCHRPACASALSG
ncbi:hypothetical protein DPMN_175024 [Dreissena polymorpha]|uniref:Uncharacterized protein n=1 Tax=Dreissena polymorpha TaxID=45954 RepID=A0A9D4E5P8_DREPO|nr:hypothetical protein DPMN_175024 [Dreissena polymorpha]